MAKRDERQRDFWAVIEGGAGREDGRAAEAGAAVGGGRPPSLEDAIRRGFDVVIANPPYGVAVGERDLLARYELARAEKGRGLRSRVPSENLFMELMVRAAAGGGWVAALVCDSLLANSSTQHVRDYVGRECRLRAVVSLSDATFKPLTTVKTSVLLVQRWSQPDGCNPRLDDYSVAMAISEDAGRDRQGRLKYRRGDDGREVVASDVTETFEAVARMIVEAEADDAAESAGEAMRLAA